MPVVSPNDWREFLSGYPQAHILQTAAWGELKSSFGWEVVYLCSEQVGAQILFKKLPLGFTVAYIPKGPVGEDWGRLLNEVDFLCKTRRAVFCKMEPDIWEPVEASKRIELSGLGQPSTSVQPRRTMLIDLSGTEEDWLARMKQKTRYNIRLSQRKGVTVTYSSDAGMYHQLMSVTGERDGFSVHSRAYYQKALELFAEPRMSNSHSRSVIVQAGFEGKPMAALMVFARGGRSWYFYGASSNEDRNLMPAYLIQWEAMRWSAAQGCKEYDLWGVPDAEEETLEAQFTERSDGLWGVYRFKRGYGARLVRSVGAWDRVYNPLLYKIYQLWMKRRGEER